MSESDPLIKDVPSRRASKQSEQTKSEVKEQPITLFQHVYDNRAWRLNILSLLCGISLWVYGIGQGALFGGCVQIILLIITPFYIDVKTNLCDSHKHKIEETRGYRSPEAIQDPAKRIKLRRYELMISYGLGMSISAGMYLTGTWCMTFGIYLISVCTYHFAEYSFSCLFHYATLHPDAFLINQSKEYVIALSVSVVEYMIESFLFPGLKFESSITPIMTCLGLTMVIIGHYFRIGAEFSAKHNFTHQIQFQKRSNHELVTTGVYGWSRHPGYFGWFLWAVGTQVLMSNPLSIVLFWYASEVFFYSRIEDEEELLIHFFGQKYLDYMKRVPTRIPFIFKFKG